MTTAWTHFKLLQRLQVGVRYTEKAEYAHWQQHPGINKNNQPSRGQLFFKK